MKIRFTGLQGILLLFSIFCCAVVFPQDCKRTPQEEALKLTQMIVRELDIVDSMQRDTLYKMHLKYALLRRVSNTRQDIMERMQLMDQELKSILSLEQYTRFMNNQVNGLPRTCNSRRFYHHGKHSE